MNEELEDVKSIQGLYAVNPPDPEELSEEVSWLKQQETAPTISRWFAFFRRGGPGYLQSALTLGGGTAATMLFSGAAFGYGLLWVAPISMLLGVVIMAAIAHQTLSTGERPFESMRRHAGPFFAWSFAGGAVVSSIIWHFAQYSLAAAVIHDIGSSFGQFIPQSLGGGLVLAISLVWCFAYGKSYRAARVFESSLKFLVWAVVACFGLVVFRTGIADPVALLKGFIPFRFPESRNGVVSSTVVVGGLAAAIGANMLFLYPYTLLARGWGRHHRRLARFDLFAGMLLPYFLATTLMVMAMANTFYYGDLSFTGISLSPVEAAQALSGVVGQGLGRWIFNLGILGMALSSIILQMVCCGFVAVEVLGWKFGSRKYQLACLLPAPGVLGAVLWKDIALWVAVPTTLLCGFLLPLAYLGFIVLQKSRAYLKDDMPTGLKSYAWIGGMLSGTLILTFFLIWYAVTKGPDFLNRLGL